MKANLFSYIQIARKRWSSFRVFTRISALLFLGVTVLWITSSPQGFGAARNWRAYNGDALHTIEMWATSGRFMLVYTLFNRGGPAGAEYVVRSGVPETGESWDQSFFGFEWTSDVRSNREDWVLSIPFWFCSLCALVPVAFELRKPLRRNAGKCPNCHYDLRATPHRCPECGTQVGRTEG